MNIGLPQIVITFNALANTAITRSEKGYVGIILKDSTNLGARTLRIKSDIPATLSTQNKEYIERAFLGKPKQINVFVLGTEETNYTKALEYFETVRIDYLVGSHDITTELAKEISDWVKECRDEKGIKVKVVIPKSVSNHEGIINFDTDDIKVGTNAFTSEEYCSRIAGILAGLPSTQSATYFNIDEVDDVPHMTKTQADEKINAGKLILYYDDTVKIARGVNSLTTATPPKSEAFRKIKIVDILDLIETDIKSTIKNNYIGKVSNSYDNKCVLISAILNYYKQLEKDGLIEKGLSTIDIDIDANERYLTSIGIDASNMKEADIKVANTGDKVFLKSAIQPLDSIEDVTVSINI